MLYRVLSDVRDHSFRSNCLGIVKERLASDGEPPYGLLEYLFDGEPIAGAGILLLADDRFAALRALLSTPQTELFLSEGRVLPDDPAWDVAKVNAELERLSQAPEWWVRWFVAEFILQKPRFRTPSLMDRLQKAPETFIPQRIKTLLDIEAPLREGTPW